MTIDTIANLIDCLTLQAANLPTYKGEVGATDQDIQDVQNELALALFIESYSETINGDKKTVFQIKDAMFFGVDGSTVSAFPTFPAAAPPSTPVAGMISRANKRNKRFKAAVGYTFEIGVALGIAGEPQSIVPGEVQPDIELFGAQAGAMFTIVTAKRGQADMWDVQIRRKGSETWTTVASATGKSADITITLTTPGQAEQIEVRIQLKKNNQNYGQLSQPAYVTVNP